MEDWAVLTTIIVAFLILTGLGGFLLYNWWQTRQKQKERARAAMGTLRARLSRLQGSPDYGVLQETFTRGQKFLKNAQASYNNSAFADATKHAQDGISLVQRGISDYQRRCKEAGNLSSELASSVRELDEWGAERRAGTEYTQAHHQLTRLKQFVDQRFAIEGIDYLRNNLSCERLANILDGIFSNRPTVLIWRPVELDLISGLFTLLPRDLRKYLTFTTVCFDPSKVQTKLKIASQRFQLEEHAVISMSAPPDSLPPEHSFGFRIAQSVLSGNTSELKPLLERLTHLALTSSQATTDPFAELVRYHDLETGIKSLESLGAEKRGRKALEFIRLYGDIMENEQQERLLLEAFSEFQSPQDFEAVTQKLIQMVREDRTFLQKLKGPLGRKVEGSNSLVGLRFIKDCLESQIRVVDLLQLLNGMPDETAPLIFARLCLTLEREQTLSEASTFTSCLVELSASDEGLRLVRYFIKRLDDPNTPPLVRERLAGLLLASCHKLPTRLHSWILGQSESLLSSPGIQVGAVAKFLLEKAPNIVEAWQPEQRPQVLRLLLNGVLKEREFDALGGLLSATAISGLLSHNASDVIKTLKRWFESASLDDANTFRTTAFKVSENFGNGHEVKALAELIAEKHPSTPRSPTETPHETIAQPGREQRFQERQIETQSRYDPVGEIHNESTYEVVEERPAEEQLLDIADEKTRVGYIAEQIVAVSLNPQIPMEQGIDDLIRTISESGQKMSVKEVAGYIQIARLYFDKDAALIFENRFIREALSAEQKVKYLMIQLSQGRSFLEYLKDFNQLIELVPAEAIHKKEPHKFIPDEDVRLLEELDEVLQKSFLKPRHESLEKIAKNLKRLRRYLT